MPPSCNHKRHSEGHAHQDMEVEAPDVSRVFSLGELALNPTRHTRMVFADYL